MIWIKGNDEILVKIKKVWNDKDWNIFRNFGILYGKDNFFFKFKLEEIILKNYF